jgi:3-phenylpropionate/trans-cinnamate dioxygenase ferredoxin subunit
MTAQSEPEWHLVATIDDVPEEDVIQVVVGDQFFALYNVDGVFFATDDLCTHEEARLSDGFVIDNIIECPLHQGRFHIPTGTAKGAPVTCNLRTYLVKAEGNKVYIGLSQLEKIE